MKKYLIKSLIICLVAIGIFIIYYISNNKEFNKLNSLTQLCEKDFDFINLDMQYIKIIDRVGKPHGINSPGVMSVYYELCDGNRMSLQFWRKKLKVAIIESKSGELLKYYLTQEIVYNKQIVNTKYHKSKFKEKYALEHDFTKLRKGMAFKELYKEIGYPNRITSGKDSRLIYNLQDEKILSLKIDNGLSEAQILNKNGKFLSKYYLK